MRAVADGEHHRRDEHRDHHFDEREAARGASAIRSLAPPVPGRHAGSARRAGRAGRLRVAARIVRGPRAGRCRAAAPQWRRCRSDCALPTTSGHRRGPVELLGRAAAGLHSSALCCDVGLSTARESSTVSPVGRARTSTRNMSLDRQLGDFFFPLPAHAAHLGVAACACPCRASAGRCGSR